MGKTSFALNIATNVARLQKVPTIIFSLEMTCEQLTDRILSSTAGIDSQTFRTGRLNDSDWNDLVGASTLLTTRPSIWTFLRHLGAGDQGQDPPDQPGPQKEKIGLVIIDYLQLMQSSKRTESRVQEISDIHPEPEDHGQGAERAGHRAVPAVPCGRKVQRPVRPPAPAFRPARPPAPSSRTPTWCCFLIRAAYYNSQNGEGEQADENVAECIVAKNRHGETTSVRLGWDGAHTRFMNLDYGHDDFG